MRFGSWGIKPNNCQGALLNNLCLGNLKCCISEPTSSENFVKIQDLVSLTGSPQSARLRFIRGQIKLNLNLT